MFKKNVAGMVALSILLLCCFSTVLLAKEKVTIEGTIVCTCCALKHDSGANAQCSAYGHVDGLKTADGAYWSFINNKLGNDLSTNHAKYSGKKVKITGKTFHNAHFIDVEKVEILSEKTTKKEEH